MNELMKNLSNYEQREEIYFNFYMLYGLPRYPLFPSGPSLISPGKPVSPFGPIKIYYILKSFRKTSTYVNVAL